MRDSSTSVGMQRGIYALYADYELVYLGQTGGGEIDHAGLGERSR
jgi:hypothetical protein